MKTVHSKAALQHSNSSDFQQLVAVSDGQVSMALWYIEQSFFTRINQASCLIICEHGTVKHANAAQQCTERDSVAFSELMIGMPGLAISAIVVAAH